MHEDHTLELFVLANENTKYSATPKKIYDDMNDSQISFDTSTMLSTLIQLFGVQESYRTTSCMDTIVNTIVIPFS
jgi:hypothetical protein